jgi:streptogramin lyase
MKPSFKQFRSAGATLLAARYKLQSTLILGLALVAVSLGNTAQAKSRSFPISAPTSQPISIRMGPDGNFWCTEQNGSRVARITPLGVIPNAFASTRGACAPRSKTYKRCFSSLLRSQQT